MTDKKNSSSDTDCRVCGKKIAHERDKKGPFCSERCRLNDLSKWFGESYRIASSPTLIEGDDADSEGHQD
jgi:endogenous inhibitor of DNA gyrase (YacG/DUF329 family)